MAVVAPAARRRRRRRLSRGHRRRHGLEGVRRPAALLASCRRSKIVEVCRAVGLLFRDHGDRYIRMYARLKFVVHRLGIDRCRELVNEYLDRDGDRPQRLRGAADRGLRPGRCPIARCASRDPRGTDGLAIQRIKIPKGELSFRASRARSPSCPRSTATSTSTARTGRTSNCTASSRGGCRSCGPRSHAMGLEADDFFGLSDVVSCVGTTYCPLAVSSTHTMFDLLQRPGPRREVRGRFATRCWSTSPAARTPARPIASPTSACAGCGSASRSARPKATRSPSAARRTASARWSASSSRTIASRVVATILDTFLRLRTRRRDAGRQRRPAGHRAVSRSRRRRWASTTRRRSIRWSCRSSPAGARRRWTSRRSPATSPAARPARRRRTCPSTSATSPTAGLDEAHRVNQEDNVLPGVLGRICTRPCEDRCRYQWTSIKGPVRICHLKRSRRRRQGRARASRCRPTSAPAARRVAIVGGGPAGLAAARELKRYGHDVTIFEREPYLGGQIRIGIPDLPPAARSPGRRHRRDRRQRHRRRSLDHAVDAARA